MEQEIISAVITSVIAFFVVYFLTPLLIKDLEKRNHTVKDVLKKGNVMVVRPGGPSIIAGILASEFALYAFFPTNEIVAIIITTSLCFIVGLIDDKKVLGGWFKPIALAVAAVPIIFLGAYDSDLAFPIFGEVKIPVLYFAIIIIMIVITSNTVNSIDVMNGVASGFMTIASFALTISLFIVQNYEIAIASLPLGFASLAFYKYHKFPSKIFPGDSGALTLGGMYGTLAIVGQVEIIAAVALLPAVVNSFLFLASMKKIVEHREIKTKPVEITEDFKLKSSPDKKAPISLVRLIVSAQPLSEKQVGSVIFKLGIFSGILAVITSFLMVVKI